MQTTGLRGLKVSDEKRCSSYDPDDYSYSQSVEPQIIAGTGGRIYGPHTVSRFMDREEIDIEYIVARSDSQISAPPIGFATLKRASIQNSTAAHLLDACQPCRIDRGPTPNLLTK